MSAAVWFHASVSCEGWCQALLLVSESLISCQEDEAHLTHLHV